MGQVPCTAWTREGPVLPTAQHGIAALITMEVLLVSESGTCCPSPTSLMKTVASVGTKSEGGIQQTPLGGPATAVASAAAAALTAVAASANTAKIAGGNRGVAIIKEEAGKDAEQRAGRQKISTSEIQMVQNLIERCLQLYMPQKDVAATLQTQAKIEPGFTNLVWEKLEEQNQDFFKAYYLRLKVKDQIVMFNYLLEQQAMMVQRLQMGWMQNMSAMGMPRPGMPMMPMTGPPSGVQPMPGMGMPLPLPSGMGGYPMMPIPMGGSAGASGNMDGVGVVSSQMPTSAAEAGQAPSTAPLLHGSYGDMHMAGGVADSFLDPFDGIDCLVDGDRRRRLGQQGGGDGPILGDVLPKLTKDFSFSDFGNFDLQLGNLPGPCGPSMADLPIGDIDTSMMMPSSARQAGTGTGQNRARGSGGSCSIEDNAEMMMPGGADSSGRHDGVDLADALVGEENALVDEENSMFMLGVGLGGMDESGDVMTGAGLPGNFMFGDMATLDFGVLPDQENEPVPATEKRQ